MRIELTKYTNLIENFLSGKASALHFEKSFLHLYKNDPTQWNESEYKILENLFYAVDSFCADPQLREVGDLDEHQLREAAARARSQIQLT